MKKQAETDIFESLELDLSVLDELLHMDFSELDQVLTIQTEQAG